ncbi:phosphatase PAP2 family protein [Patescibacteria group bacterium]|nr:phosphatase PAP2 family protein [Patescibacteria group bacterium]
MTKRPILYLFLVLIFLAIFDFIFGDRELFILLNKGIANPILDFIFLKILMPLFLLLPTVPFFMLFSKKYRKLGFTALISGPLFYLIGQGLKILFSQSRPLDVLDARILGPWHTSTFSFPSTTTMLAFGFALPIFLKEKKIGFPLLILAFLVGVSVIYTGFHFPKDVIAGAFFATLLASLLDVARHVACPKFFNGRNNLDKAQQR